MNKRVLILGARSPIALEWARSLYRSGHRVIMVDSLQFPISRWSNSIEKYIQIPSPVYHFKRFKQVLIALVQSENITDCLPINEECFYLAKIKDALACKVWTSDFELLDKLHRKDQFMELAKSHFSVPFTTTLLSKNILDRSESFVFKAIYSRFAAQIYIRPKIEELANLKKKSGKWIAQEFIEGTEYCVYVFANKGRTNCMCIYEPLIRVGKGAGIYLKEVNIPVLQEQVESFVESIAYNGQISFDVIQRGTSFYVIECNPRGTSGAHFIGDNLYKTLGESPISNSCEARCRSLKLILFCRNPFIIFTRKWRKSKDFVWSKSDVKPTIFQFLTLIEMLFVALKKGIKPLEATCHDIAWNGDE